MNATVRKISSDADRDACYLVRMEVFVDEQAVPPWEEMDEHDETADHFAVEVDGKIVGTARIVDAGGIGKIGRVAILKPYRGAGLGAELMQLVISEGFKRFETLILDAQVSVIPFYERLGFVAEGPVFLDCNIEHRKMKRRRKYS